MKQSNFERGFAFWTLALFFLGLILGIETGHAASITTGGNASSSWKPPFTPASAGFAARAQNLMAPGLNPDSEFDRRVPDSGIPQIPQQERFCGRQSVSEHRRI